MNHRFCDVSYRPLTLPNYLDSKKPVKSHKPSYYARPASSSYGSQSYGDGGSAHGHDFIPLRGSSDYGGDDAAGYSYGVGAPNKYFGDYQDGPPPPPPTSSSSYHTAGPKSFVSVSSRLKEYAPDGAVINVHHGYGYDTADDGRYRHRPYHAPAADYESDESGDPLHPLRDYHSTAHDDEDMYARLRHEYQSKARKSPALPASSPYFVSARGAGGDDDYGEPSSSRAEWTRQRDVDGQAPKKQQAYWRMSFTQDV